MKMVGFFLAWLIVTLSCFGGGINMKKVKEENNKWDTFAEEKAEKIRVKDMILPPINKIVDAIYLAEGGKETRFLYGIKRVGSRKIKPNELSQEEARRICFNSVRNNIRRWENAGRPGDFFEFMAKRYAPIGAKNDPTGLNRNWVNSVKSILKREE